jgi:hypothetical protein
MSITSVYEYFRKVVKLFEINIKHLQFKNTTNMIDLSIFTKEEIDLSIEKTINNFSMMRDMDMSRLDRQIDITRKILYSFSTTESKIAIIDAPTGFGKSILGFFLHRTMMYLINDFYKNKKNTMKNIMKFQ